MSRALGAKRCHRLRGHHLQQLRLFKALMHDACIHSAWALGFGANSSTSAQGVQRGDGCTTDPTVIDSWREPRHNLSTSLRAQV
mmetsp:Transcript_25796/g.71895  ORF Transcript_25796/g.71895 Transcript_25796/m.71895 type:complete len:84 (-) Transcript_25796:114-365(-)